MAFIVNRLCNRFMGSITQHFPKSFDHWILLSIDYGLGYADHTFPRGPDSTQLPGSASVGEIPRVPDMLKTTDRNLATVRSQKLGINGLQRCLLTYQSHASQPSQHPSVLLAPPSTSHPSLYQKPFTPRGGASLSPAILASLLWSWLVAPLLYRRPLPPHLVSWSGSVTQPRSAWTLSSACFLP